MLLGDLLCPTISCTSSIARWIYACQSSYRRLAAVLTALCKHGYKSLGKGSYGTVRLGRHITTKRRVAIKTIKVGNGETWKELKNEVNIMKNLRHPNIVQLYETYSESDTLHLIMAECSGGDLTAWLKKRMKNFGKACDADFEKVVARFIVKTLSALAYMHHRKICQ